MHRIILTWPALLTSIGHTQYYLVLPSIGKNALPQAYLYVKLLMQDGGHLADCAVRTALTAAIRERCNCNFQSTSIDSGEFSCQTTTTHVYRSLINGTSEMHTAPKLLDFINNWLKNEGTFRILHFRLRVVPDCPLQIQSFHQPECMNGGVQVNQTLM